MNTFLEEEVYDLIKSIFDIYFVFIKSKVKETHDEKRRKAQERIREAKVKSN